MSGIKSAVRRRRMTKLQKKQALQGYLFLLPTIVLFCIFTFATVLMGVIYSFTDMAPGNPSTFNWTWYNYEIIFKDRVFLYSILNVLIYAAMSVPLTIVTSILVAALLNRKLRGVKFFRVIYYLPAVTSGIATAFIWRWLYNENYGLFNTILTQWFGMAEGFKWVNAQSYFAMFCIAIVSAWSGLGGNMLIYLAAMQSISPELYEAASLDGANGWQKLIKITVPLLRSTTFFIITMSLIGSFQLYDIVALMGGENSYTQTPVMQIYGSFRHAEGGMASAQSVILFLVIMVATFVTQKIVKEKQA